MKVIFINKNYYIIIASYTNEWKCLSVISAEQKK